MSEPECSTEDSVWGWQGQTTTVADRAKHALSTEAFTDIAFQFHSDGGTVTNVKAHKCMLAMGSSVFETMFFGSMPETRSTVPIIDIDLEAFRIMLRYIYQDQIGPFDTTTAFPTLYAAKKYGVCTLKNAALEYLKKSVTVENCVYWLAQAHHYAEEDMQQLCMDLIDREGTTVLQSEDFLQIDLDVLQSVLCRDTLRVLEVNVYTAATRWASNQCREKGIEDCGTNHRIILGEVLRVIRFPVMTQEETAAAVESNLLSADEVSDLFLWYAKKNVPQRWNAVKRALDTSSKVGANGEPNILVNVKPLNIVHSILENVKPDNWDDRLYNSYQEQEYNWDDMYQDNREGGEQRIRIGKAIVPMSCIRSRNSIKPNAGHENLSD